MDGGSNVASDQVIAELISMGFQISEATKAIKEVGPSLDVAVDFILNANANAKRKTNLPGTGKLGRVRQLSIMDHLQSGRSKIIKTSVSIADTHGEKCEPVNTSFLKDEDAGSDWEVRANTLLHHHFGYTSLKPFQKEALEAWIANKDCLVLAATGSGKSLCFQIPALLTGKVVVVISPLISLMHDQCLKLARHGVSACFLGSGQIDNSAEQKAMEGKYQLIYVCPETILRLIKPLQTLAQSRGIALFAIDEVHCVSKWGHDFRPDYRRLSALRENFNVEKLAFLKSNIPIMALTATATIRVREDILKSLKLSEDPNIVLTSFFRPNIRFSVKHSRTSPSSYERDFCELIKVYTNNQSYSNTNILEESEKNWLGFTEERDSFVSDDDISLSSGSFVEVSKRKELSVEYLEDDCDLSLDVDDFDVTCGEFDGSSTKDLDACGSSSIAGGGKMKTELEQDSTIIYVPTRKETSSIANYLCRRGLIAAAYHAKLPKSQLRKVHKEFHDSAIQVVVATIAFGMGIDKSNVRRIIHYGWPQSLEAYYQEAGRAGRDGKLADCVLYANLSRMPSLLPSRRSEEQTRQAYKMLSDCFRYAICTSRCRAQMLVHYFGEDFIDGSCHSGVTHKRGSNTPHFLIAKNRPDGKWICGLKLMCDICIKGPPEKQDVKDEARILMQTISDHYEEGDVEGSYDDYNFDHNRSQTCTEKPNVKMFVRQIREQSQQLATTDLLWWQGLVRVLEDKAFLREGDNQTHVQIKFPELTKLGLEYLRTKSEQTFYIYPEADMLLSQSMPKAYASFSEWGKGWANPEIRKQRLARNRPWKKPRQRKKQKCHTDMKTVKGRLAAKLSK